MRDGGWSGWVLHASLAGLVATLAIAVYDVTVQRPRSLRLAVVDVATLYGLAQARATRQVMGHTEPPSAGASATAASAAAELGALFRTAEDFGPALQETLTQIAGDCRCTLVAMAAVFGADASVPDYTAVAAERLHLRPLPEAAR